MTHYQTLGVTQDATADEIKQAFRRLARQYHPDRNKAADAGVKMQAINRAYDVLSNAQKRREYDRELYAQTRQYKQNHHSYKGRRQHNYQGGYEEAVRRATEEAFRRAYEEATRQKQTYQSQHNASAEAFARAQKEFIRAQAAYKSAKSAYQRTNPQQGNAPSSTVGLGRIRRREYAIGLLWGFVGVILGAIGNFISEFIGYIVFFILAIYHLILHIERLHDLGQSGLWSLLMFIPILNLILILILIFAKGQEGINRYGPDPRQAA